MEAAVASIPEKIHSCTPQHPCVGDMSGEGPESQKHQGQVAHEVFKVVRQLVFRQQQGAANESLAILSASPPPLPRVFICNSCGIDLTAYDPQRLPHEQRISCLQFLWKEPETCRTAFNLKSLVCRGCREIWEICDCQRREVQPGPFAALSVRGARGKYPPVGPLQTPL